MPPFCLVVFMYTFVVFFCFFLLYLYHCMYMLCSRLWLIGVEGRD